MTIEKRLTLLSLFEAAPISTLFKQETIAAVLDCSPAKLERDRWEGKGIPYIKDGKAVRYRKSSVLKSINSLPLIGGDSDEKKSPSNIECNAHSAGRTL